MANTLTELLAKKCTHRPTKLAEPEVAALLALLPSCTRHGQEIVQTFRFATYRQTVAAFNAVAEVAEAENHHPDCEVGYGKLAVRFTTHDCGGLSINDFICAAKCQHAIASQAA